MADLDAELQKTARWQQASPEKQQAMLQAWSGYDDAGKQRLLSLAQGKAEPVVQAAPAPTVIPENQPRMVTAPGQAISGEPVDATGGTVGSPQVSDVPPGAAGTMGPPTPPAFRTLGAGRPQVPNTEGAPPPAPRYQPASLTYVPGADPSVITDPVPPAVDLTDPSIIDNAAAEGVTAGAGYLTGGAAMAPAIRYPLYGATAVGSRALRNAVMGRPQESLPSNLAYGGMQAVALPMAERVINPAVNRFLGKPTGRLLDHVFGTAARRAEVVAGTAAERHALATNAGPLLAEGVGRDRATEAVAVQTARDKAAGTIHKAQVDALSTTQKAMQAAAQQAEAVDQHLGSLHRKVEQIAGDVGRQAEAAMGAPVEKRVQRAVKQKWRDDIKQMVGLNEATRAHSIQASSAPAATAEGVNAYRESTAIIQKAYQETKGALSARIDDDLVGNPAKGMLGKLDKPVPVAATTKMGENLDKALLDSIERGFKPSQKVRELIGELGKYRSTGIGTAQEQYEAQKAAGVPAHKMRTIDPEGTQFLGRDAILYKAEAGKLFTSNNPADRHLAGIITDEVDRAAGKLISPELRALWYDLKHNWDDAAVSRLYHGTRPGDMEEFVGNRWLGSLKGKIAEENKPLIQQSIADMLENRDIKIEDLPKAIGSPELLEWLYGPQAANVNSWKMLQLGLDDLPRLYAEHPEWAAYAAEQSSKAVEDTFRKSAVQIKKHVLATLNNLGPTGKSLVREFSARSPEEVTNFYMERMAPRDGGTQFMESATREAGDAAEHAGRMAMDHADTAYDLAGAQIAKAHAAATESIAGQVRSAAGSLAGKAPGARLQEALASTEPAGVTDFYDTTMSQPDFREAVMAETAGAIPIGSVKQSIRWGIGQYGGAKLAAYSAIGLTHALGGAAVNPYTMVGAGALTADLIGRNLRSAVVHGLENGTVKKLLAAANNRATQALARETAAITGQSAAANALHLALGLIPERPQQNDEPEPAPRMMVNAPNAPQAAPQPPGAMSAPPPGPPVPPQAAPAGRPPVPPVAGGPNGPMPPRPGPPMPPPVDPVRQELAIHQVEIPQHRSFQVPGNLVTDAVSVAKFQQAVEQAAHAKVSALVGQPGYRQASPQSQRTQLQAAIRGSKNIALGMMRGELGELMSKRSKEPAEEAPDPLG